MNSEWSNVICPNDACKQEPSSLRRSFLLYLMIVSSSFQYFLCIPLALTQSQERKEPSPVIVKAQGTALFTSLRSKDPSSFQHSTPAICFHRHTEKHNIRRLTAVAQEDSCATVWGCKQHGSHFSCLQTNRMSQRKHLRLNQAVKGDFHTGFFGAAIQWLTCTSKVMKQWNNLVQLLLYPLTTFYAIKYFQNQAKCNQDLADAIYLHLRADSRVTVKRG